MKWNPLSWSKRIKIPIIIVLAIMVGYKTFFHYQEPNEVGIARNQVTGEVTIVDKGGFHRNYPWVWVAIIDTRPTQVCVTSGSRAINCKLVHFLPQHYQEFVITEGWRFYWWSNRISFNWSHNEEYRGMNDILKGYAYSAKKYPFIEITKEYDQE